MPYCITHEIGDHALYLQTVCVHVGNPDGHIDPECALLAFHVRLHRCHAPFVSRLAALMGTQMGRILARFNPGEVEQVTE